MKIYLYKSYCDEYAYGEEIVEAYANKEDALKRLKKDVEENFGVSWNDIPSEIGLREGDTFETSYVSIYLGGGVTSFWSVEELEVK